MEAAKMQISVIKFHHLKSTYKKTLGSAHALYYTFFASTQLEYFCFILKTCFHKIKNIIKS